MPCYYAIVDPAQPDPATPWSLFRTPDKGGPPTELYDPETGEWDEDVSLIGYFTGDEMGAVKVPEEAVASIQAVLRDRMTE